MRINDFTVQVATVNGSGSQSSNLVLMRSVFNMGIPVVGKNLFPSNISGLPTWFTIRVSGDGWMANKRDADICVALNEATAAADIEKLRPGSVAILPDKSPVAHRSDVITYTCPFAALAGEVTSDTKLRKLLANMVYVGVLAELIGLTHESIEAAVKRQFRSKQKAVDLNMAAIKKGRDYAKSKIEKRDPFKLAKLDKTKGKILMEGNAATALGAVFGGLTVLAWYPITPSSSLAESAMDYLAKYRVDKQTGKHHYAVVQAEDELASLGLVLGAGWAGARALTNTSGPGISLMSEFVGLGYFTEIPAVIVDVQRMGPSTGLPTRTNQGDILKVAYLSHGDTRHIALIPGNLEECFSFAVEAFDLAEEFQTPVFLLTDLDLGMNTWMSDPFKYPEKPINRGKVLDLEKLETHLAKFGKFERYRDVDGDGIPYRTLPGTHHPQAAYFTRGSGHSEAATYTENPQTWARVLDRIAHKIDRSKERIPQPIEHCVGKGPVGIIAYGSSHFAIEESLDQLNKAGVKADYLRIRGLPLNGAVTGFIARHERVYVVDQNQTAQMGIIIRSMLGEDAQKIRSVRHYDGMALDAEFVTQSILDSEKEA